jgi:hypothetical protein
MDDAGFVRCRQRPRSLQANIEDPLAGQRVAGQGGVERVPRNVLHNQEPAPVPIFQAVERTDVGVIKCRQVPRFGAERFQRVCILGQALGNKLESDGSAQDGILGLPDLAHRTLAGLFHQPVMQQRCPGPDVGCAFGLQGQGPDRRNEAVATTRDAFDETRVSCGVADRFPQPFHGRTDALLEFDNRSVRPQKGPDALARHKLTGVLDQSTKDFE